jgi:lipoic acid synthetase
MKMDPSLHQERKPDWIKVRLPNNPAFWSTKSLITDLKLVTVCEEAQCPNRWECWGQGTATFMIAGEKCTRACGFCAVKTAKPDALEEDASIDIPILDDTGGRSEHTQWDQSES